jgi:hypothetical protein
MEIPDIEINQPGKVYILLRSQYFFFGHRLTLVCCFWILGMFSNVSGADFDGRKCISSAVERASVCVRVRVRVRETQTERTKFSVCKLSVESNEHC